MTSDRKEICAICRPALAKRPNPSAGRGALNGLLGKQFPLISQGTSQGCRTVRALFGAWLFGSLICKSIKMWAN